MSSGDSPERPIFVANVPAPVESIARRRSGCLASPWLRGGCVAASLGGGLLVLMSTVAAVGVIRQCTQQVVAPLARGAAQVMAASGPVQGTNFSDHLSDAIAQAMLLSWGIDRVQENRRRLEFVGQSLLEYERRHGRPPDSLDQLNLLQGDRCDVWDTPLEYRVVGSPKTWQIRSAGMNRRFEPQDPWLPER